MIINLVVVTANISTQKLDDLNKLYTALRYTF